MPPAEFAAEGVYCTGDDCHKIQPKWERDKSEVMPPKSTVDAVWTVEGFGAGKGSSGGIAPIHLGDTAVAEKAQNEEKLAPKSASAPKPALKKKSAKASHASAVARKARR